MLLVFTRLGLRIEEVARLALKDIDWEGGEIRVCSSKTRRERMLPLPQDVGDGLIAHLRTRPQKDSPWAFVPRRPPFTEQRRHHHVRSTMADLFRRAGLRHARVHSLRHSAATGMVNRGASFKEIEVVALQLDDLHWRAGEFLVRGKGLFHDRLPLPLEVARL